ncbi:hypothetical protein ACFX12_039737 [Malus domestica]
MSFKGIVRELREMKDEIGSMLRRVGERKHWRSRTLSHIAPDMAPTPPTDVIQQGQWANLPPELLLDIIQRVEESETSWPARAVVVFCGSCFIRRGRETSTYYLYYGLVPSEDDFSRASTTYVGKLRSNFLGTKFTVHDSQPPCDAVPQLNNRSSRRFHSKQDLRHGMELPLNTRSSRDFSIQNTTTPPRLHRSSFGLSALSAHLLLLCRKNNSRSSSTPCNNLLPHLKAPSMSTATNGGDSSLSKLLFSSADSLQPKPCRTQPWQQA